MPGEVVRVLHDRRRVVAAFPLPDEVVARLETLIGGDCQIIDIRDADGHEHLVLTPSASPQLLGQLHVAFPDARVLLVELTDLEHEVHFGGPVTGALDAGADAYLVARSLEELAGLLRRPEAGEAVVPAAAQLPAPGEQRVTAALEDLINRGAKTAGIRKSD